MESQYRAVNMLLIGGRGTEDFTEVEEGVGVEVHTGELR